MKFTDAADRWNQRYRDAGRPLFGAKPNGWLSAQAELLKSESAVLCVADGDGRNGLFLAGLGHQVTSFDIADVAVDATRRRAAELGFSLDARVSDLQSWQWPADSYDAVVAIFIQFADPASRADLFAAIRSSLRPGGLLIIEGYGVRQLAHRTGGPGVIENLYGADLLAREFPGWPVLAGRDCELVLTEGAAHNGRSHVISSVLRRPGSTGQTAYGR
jgi:SAM-dependent methyltransferase